MVAGVRRKLSLDSLTLTNCRPQDTIRAAAGAGFDACSLWIHAPALYALPLLTRADERECAAILADTRIELIALEVLDLFSSDVVESSKPQLEMGARLGGKSALAINYSNADRAASADLLAQFAEAAAQFGLGVNLEPVCGGKSQTLAEAHDLVIRSGADVGICFDPHHLVRMGGGLSELLALPKGAVRYVQVCDGPLSQPPEIVATEAVCERLYPGDGDFPLRDLLGAAPSDVVIGVECPSVRRAQAGVSAMEQAKEAMAKTRNLLALLD